MRAIQLQSFGGPEVLEPAEVAGPEPLPTEILVRLAAAGVNPVDIKTRQGGGMADVLGEPPLIVGWDAAGVVEQVGFGVTRFEVGDRVLGMPWFPRQGGCYAELVTAPSRHFVRAPEALSDAEAAGLPLAGLTAWQALVDTAAAGEGDRVLIHAASGGVGHLATQIAASLGCEVIGTSRAANHDFLAGLGAERAIDYTEADFTEQTSELDLVVDLVGGEEHGLRSLEVLKPGGLLIAVPGGVSEKVAEAAADQGKRATGILVEPDVAGLERLVALVAAGELRVEVAEVLALEQAARAHELSESGSTRGKLVLSLDG